MTWYELIWLSPVVWWRKWRARRLMRIMERGLAGLDRVIERLEAEERAGGGT